MATDIDGRDRHDPWRNGHIRTVILRKISGEENVSIEFYHAEEEEAHACLDNYMRLLRKHMVSYNKRVILTYSKKMADLERMIHARGTQIADLDAQIEAKQAMLAGESALSSHFVPLDERGNGSTGEG